MTTKKNTLTMGKPLKKIKDLPKSIITHMPFIMFRPHLKEHDGKEYMIMDYLYFYKNLIVTSPYQNGEYFDEMPVNNVLAFKAEAFDKKVKTRVIKNTYYFNVNFKTDTLGFKMDASEQTIQAYNKANPKNPLGGHEGYVHPVTGLPMFFTEECEIIIPPPPPGVG